MTRRRFPVGKTLLYVFMSLWALTTIYPFIWVILNSFKPRGLIRSDTFSLPIGDKFTLENYVTAFKRVDIRLRAEDRVVFVAVQLPLDPAQQARDGEEFFAAQEKHL